jgi:hypothetical protein
VAKPKCPYISKPCLKHSCTHYVQLHGRDPQTGAPIDDWMCLDFAMLKVQLEGNLESRGVSANVAAFRKEMVQANTDARLLQGALPATSRKVITAR